MIDELNIADREYNEVLRKFDGSAQLLKEFNEKVVALLDAAARAYDAGVYSSTAYEHMLNTVSRDFRSAINAAKLKHGIE
jgi:hypothetical protein